jgi:hypothetical protein
MLTPGLITHRQLYAENRKQKEGRKRCWSVLIAEVGCDGSRRADVEFLVGRSKPLVTLGLTEVCQVIVVAVIGDRRTLNGGSVAMKTNGPQRLDCRGIELQIEPLSRRYWSFSPFRSADGLEFTLPRLWH